MNARGKMADLAKEHHDRQYWQIWWYFTNFVTAVHLSQLKPLGGWRFGGVYMSLEVQLQEVAPSQARDRKGVGVGIYRKAEWTVGRQIWFCCRVVRPRAIIPFWVKNQCSGTNKLLHLHWRVRFKSHFLQPIFLFHFWLSCLSVPHKNLYWIFKIDWMNKCFILERQNLISPISAFLQIFQLNTKHCLGMSLNACLIHWSLKQSTWT